MKTNKLTQILSSLNNDQDDETKQTSPMPIMKHEPFVSLQHDKFETNFFPIEYFLPILQLFKFSQLKNRTEEELWNSIKRHSLQESIFKGGFIGLKGKDETLLTLSKFKAVIDQADETQDLSFVIIKERFENVFSAIEDRLVQLNSQDYNTFSINTLAKDASFNSCVMEGNTATKEEFKASESEEEDLLTPEIKEIRVLSKMHENYQNAIINGKVYTIDEELLLSEHKEMAIGLGEEAGHFRRVNIYVQGSTHKFAKHETIRTRLASVLKIFQSKIKESKTLEERIKAAIYLHYEIVNIHPFRNYNGKMARYIMNLVLFQYCKIPPVSVMPDVKSAYFASIREIDKNNDYSYLTTIITESIIRSLEKSLYYTQEQEGMGVLLKKLNFEQLSKYCSVNNISRHRYSKSEMIRKILRSCQRSGETALVLDMEKHVLQLIVQEKELSQLHLYLRLFEILSASNMKEILHLLNDDVLDHVLETLRMKDNSSKDGKIKAIMEEVGILGMRIGLNNLNEQDILEICNELNVTSLRSKIENIYSIIGVVFPHYVTSQHLLFKENIWNIKQGVSLEELYQFNYLELIKYSETHGLKISYKSKKKTCKAILEYFEGNLKRPNEEVLKENKRMKH